MKMAPALRMRAASCFGIRGRDLQMLGRERDRPAAIASSKLAHQDDGAEVAPRGAATAPRGSVVSCRSTAPLDRGGKRAFVGDQDRLRGDVVLGLREEIGRDPVRVGVVVGEDQHLGRPGDHVDADRAEHQPLGGRHIGVAGADDLGDRRDRRGAVGERRHRLRAADPIDLVDAGELRRRQHQRLELAVRASAPP